MFINKNHMVVGSNHMVLGINHMVLGINHMAVGNNHMVVGCYQNPCGGVNDHNGRRLVHGWCKQPLLRINEFQNFFPFIDSPNDVFILVFYMQEAEHAILAALSHISGGLRFHQQVIFNDNFCITTFTQLCINQTLCLIPFSPLDHFLVSGLGLQRLHGQKSERDCWLSLIPFDFSSNVSHLTSGHTSHLCNGMIFSVTLWDSPQSKFSSLNFCALFPQWRLGHLWARFSRCQPLRADFSWSTRLNRFCRHQGFTLHPVADRFPPLRDSWRHLATHNPLARQDNKGLNWVCDLGLIRWKWK